MLQGDEYRTVLLDEARNADVSAFAHLFKSGMAVTKDYELLQAASLLADVNEFIFRIILIQLLDLCAVRAAFHYIYFSNDLILALYNIHRSLQQSFIKVRERRKP